jgi:hypothetical protein
MLTHELQEDSPEIIEQRTSQSIAVKEIFWWAPKLNWLYPVLFVKLNNFNFDFDFANIYCC